MAPWTGPRHRSPFRDTNIATVMFVVIFSTYLVWEIAGTAPQGLVSLLGVAGGAWFGAVSGDKRKRDADTERTANDAQATAHRAEDAANRAGAAAAAGDARADAAEVRETQRSARDGDDDAQ